jgi:hypothetical protein
MGRVLPQAPRRYPTPSRCWMPDGGPQSADDDDDEAGELHTHRHPTTEPKLVAGRRPAVRRRSILV